MQKFKKSFLLWCLMIVFSLQLAPYAMATGNIIDEFTPTHWLCASSGEILITYADVDDDPSTGVWVGGTWYPNETQIALYPIQGDLSVNYAPLHGEIFFSFIGTNCGETGWQTEKGQFVIRFIDATAPGWVWDDPSTWQEKRITEAQLAMSNDGIGNWTTYFGHLDPGNVVNPFPYQQAKAYEHWGGVNQLDEFSIFAWTYEAGTLASPTGFSEILFTTDFAESSIHYLNLFGTISGNTPAGSDVGVSIGDVAITFETVTDAGNTSVTESDTGPLLPSNFAASCTPPVYYDITTTATYSGDIEVCLSYDDSVCDETDLRLYHYEGGAWVDCTTSVDTTSNIICGTVTSLSTFVLLSPTEEPPCYDPGDFDGDCDVDMEDVNTFRSALGTSEGDPGYNPCADLDGDNRITMNDYRILRSIYTGPGTGCP